jgi:uncharacterized delta-60 repeat protein
MTKSVASATISVAAMATTSSAYASIEQPDGKIVVAGHEANRTLLVLRFHANGTLDTTFADRGRFLLTGVTIWGEGGVGLDLQSDGSIVLAAMTYFSGPGNAVLVRLTPSGALDSTFAGQGMRGLTLTSRAFLKRVFVLPDGKIVTGGNYPQGIWSARYLANGDDDVSYGTQGKKFLAQATQNNHTGQIGQLLPLPDGKMLMLSLGILSETREAWVVDRLTAAGVIDPTFTRISLPYTESNSWLGSMTRLPDGLIAISIPRFDAGYSAGDMVGVYSADGVAQGKISDTSFVSSLGVQSRKWDFVDHLMVRSDGALCGRLGNSLIQLLPTLRVLATGSAYTYSRLFPTADGGLLEAGQTVYPQVSRVLVRRFKADGTYTLSYFDGDLVVVSPTSKLEVRDVDSRVLLPSTQRNYVTWGKIYNGTSYVNAVLPTLPQDVTAFALGEAHGMALRANGSVVPWGKTRVVNEYVDAYVPSGLSDIVAIASGANHVLALRQNGLVVAWGSNVPPQSWGGPGGQSTVPLGLSDVVAIAAGKYNSVALKRNGSVVAWGWNGHGQLGVPANLQDIVAISASPYNTYMLRKDGTILAIGSDANSQISGSATLRNITAISAGWYHGIGLTQSGTIASWGNNTFQQREVPAGLSGVAAVATGGVHTLALKQDGRLVTWGHNDSGQLNLPRHLRGFSSIAAANDQSVAVADALALSFQATQLDTLGVPQVLTLKSTGSSPLMSLRIEIVGEDADQFRAVPLKVTTLGAGGSTPLTIQFLPTRIGPQTAQLQIFSSDPDASPFVLNLAGEGRFEMYATKASIKESVFTYAPLTVDPTTGSVVQKVTFYNPTHTTLQGLRLTLAGLAPRVSVASSSPGPDTGMVEVIYSKPIAAGETVQFFLTYFDSRRRTSAAMQPSIHAEALLEREPRSELVKGALSPILGVRDTAQGPLVEWNCKPNAIYVVEYSDDRGATWFSAVHRLTRNSTRLLWIDRGQPETFSKPVNKASRSYRVERL